jgi:hypothetical protein
MGSMHLLNEKLLLLLVFVESLQKQLLANDVLL